MPEIMHQPPPPAPLLGEQSPAWRRRRRRHSGADNSPQGGGSPGGLEVFGGAGRGGKPRGMGDEAQKVEWMLREFKTAPCSLEASSSSHDHRCCPFYHSGRDRRRPVFLDNGGLAYQGEPCTRQFDDSRTCSHGDACNLCHSSAELLYHPDFLRKRLCHQARRCPRGKFCAFAHARQELLVPHFLEQEEAEPTEEFIAYRFKTQWCPIGGPHDWENCVYAHTYRDWRRVPILGYSSHPCPRWTNSVARSSPETTYSDRCPYGMACPLAHGAKEQLYHPQFYKTSPCSDSDCRRGPLCAFTHGEHDARQLRLEDAAPRAPRRPIPQAEELLRQYQPTFSEPPMYHALEILDAPRGSGSGASPNAKPRNRRRGGGGGGSSCGGGSSSISLASEIGSAPLMAVPPIGDASRVELVGGRQQVSLPLPFGGEQRSAVVTPYPSCQFMGYQWVSVAESPNTHAHLQSVPPTLGYPVVPSEHRVLNYTNTPMVWNPGPVQGQLHASSNFPGASQCFLTVPQPCAPSSPNPMTVGPSPADSPMRVPRPASDESADAADRSPSSNLTAFGMAAGARSPMDLKVPAMFGGPRTNLTVEVSDFTPNPPDFAAWQQSLVEASDFPCKPANLLAWKQKYCAKDGWRTPSSFGSPPLSIAPTAASSPRTAEAPSSTHTGDSSEQNSWDEPLRESLP
mmetsp:Transcript_30431/g.59693  ORF Transcript_30431/g.59693 Transcript_30431/m.59693 type:complete len:682 (-) Transcript_30431:77-2122(-)